MHQLDIKVLNIVDAWCNHEVQILFTFTAVKIAKIIVFVYGFWGPHFSKRNWMRQHVSSLYVRLSCGNGMIPWDGHYDNRDVKPMHCIRSTCRSSRFACSCCECALSSEGLDDAEGEICGNKMPTRCNRGFYCRSYCLLNMLAEGCVSGLQDAAASCKPDT